MRWLACEVPGFSLYMISEYGDVKRKIPGRTRKHTPPKGTIQPFGYLRYKLTRDDGTRSYIDAHRLVAWTFLGPPPPKHEVAHNDGNPSNNHFSNLRWDTRKGNHADLKLHGTSVSGVRNGQSVLNEKQVKAIRKQYTGKFGQIAELSRRYNLSHSAMFAICHRINWRHI